MAGKQISFGERTRRAREAAGLSLVEASFAIRAYTPKSHQKSYAYINRIEHDEIPEDAVDLVFLEALAKAYGATVSSLSAEAAGDMKVVAALFSKPGNTAPLLKVS